MKKIFLMVTLTVSCVATFACPTCEIAQPKYLKGISHGTGPQSQWDLVIVAITAVIVLASLFFSIKFIAKPGEKSATHIKHFILNNE